MNSLAQWISPETMQALGWTLVHFLWQGAALAALLWLLLMTMRSASQRYVVSVAVMLLMLTAPAVTFTLLCAGESPGGAQPRNMFPAAKASVPETSVGEGPAAQAVPTFGTGISISPWLVEAWLVGVLALSLRSAGGLLLIGRLRRRNTSPVRASLREACEAVQRRMGLRRMITYCESQQIDAPAVLGWFRPVVLLPISVLTGLSREQLEAVVAHELAHIKRLDAFVNVFQMFVETVLFYHPAVWWVSSRIRAEREHCCDDAALAVCGDRLQYARALTMMEASRRAPRLAMAANGGSLAGRVRRLLGMESLRHTRAVSFTVGLLCLGIAMIASTALLDIAPKVSAAEPLAQAEPGAQPSAQPKPSAQSISPSPEVNPEPKPEVGQEEAAPVIAETQESSGTGSYIDGMKAAGLGDLNVDQLIALKVQGVSPEYVRALRAEGVQVTAEHVVALKVQGVTAEYVHDMKALGLESDANNLVAMKVQGIMPDYVRAMRAAGLSFTTNQLIGMKVQGITPEYIQQMHDLGLNIATDQAIAMKVQGITPEYVREIRATGLSPTTNQLIAMKVQGITPQYVKAMQQLGLKFTADEFIAAKVQDITPDFVERLQQRKFHDLNLDRLIELKHLNVVSNRAEL